MPPYTESSSMRMIGLSEFMEKALRIALTLADSSP
jgi:hypothetical protein